MSQVLLDGLYGERADIVALAVALSRRLGYAAGTSSDPNEPDWPVVYIELPTGQVSWHFSANDFAACVPGGLPEYPTAWDGHDTAEKYRRVREFVRTPAPTQFNLWGYWTAVDNLKSIGDGVSEATVTALGHAHVDERLEMGLSVGSRVLVRNDRLYGAGGPVLLVEPSGIIGHAQLHRKG